MVKSSSSPSWHPSPEATLSAYNQTEVQLVISGGVNPGPETIPHHSGQTLVEKAEMYHQTQPGATWISQRPRGPSRGMRRTSQSAPVLGHGQLCLQCGWPWHIHSSCPAVGKECKRCHRKGHFARMCRSALEPSTSAEPQEQKKVSAVSHKSPSQKKRDEKRMASYNILKSEITTLRKENEDLKARVASLQLEAQQQILDQSNTRRIADIEICLENDMKQLEELSNLKSLIEEKFKSMEKIAEHYGPQIATIVSIVKNLEFLTVSLPGEISSAQAKSAAVMEIQTDLKRKEQEILAKLTGIREQLATQIMDPVANANIHNPEVSILQHLDHISGHVYLVMGDAEDHMEPPQHLQGQWCEVNNKPPPARSRQKSNHHHNRSTGKYYY